MTPASSRDLMPDLIRAWALIGIALVNVELFSSPLSTGYLDGGSTGLWAETAVAGLFTMKSYSLFSMMFGAGLAYQMDAAERRGEKIGGTYFRRMLGLLVLGILHIVFLFIGDILVAYAILGSLFFLCRNGKPKTLIIWSIVLLVLQSLIILGMAGLFGMMEFMQTPEMRAELDAEIIAQMDADIASQEEWMANFSNAFATGSFFEVASTRAGFVPMILPMGLIFQGFGAFAFFLIGLAFMRSGMLSDTKHKFWKTCRWVFLPIGVVVSLFAGHLFALAPSPESSGGMLAMALVMAVSAFSTLGYIGLIAKLSEWLKGPVLTFIARGGSATLSAYLMQSAIMSFIFLQYGLGLFGKVNPQTGVMIALATAVFTLCFVSIWLKFFKRGPMEILLRRWTYLGKP